MASFEDRASEYQASAAPSRSLSVYSYQRKPEIQPGSRRRGSSSEASSGRVMTPVAGAWQVSEKRRQCLVGESRRHQHDLDHNQRSHGHSDEVHGILYKWLRENLTKPYPSIAEKKKLAAKTKLRYRQVSYWYTNARRRLVPKMIDAENKRRAASGLPALKVETFTLSAATSSSGSSSSDENQDGTKRSLATSPSTPSSKPGDMLTMSSMSQQLPQLPASAPDSSQASSESIGAFNLRPLQLTDDSVLSSSASPVSSRKQLTSPVVSLRDGLCVHRPKTLAPSNASLSLSSPMASGMSVLTRPPPHKSSSTLKSPYNQTVPAPSGHTQLGGGGAHLTLIRSPTAADVGHPGGCTAHAGPVLTPAVPSIAYATQHSESHTSPVSSLQVVNVLPNPPVVPFMTTAFHQPAVGHAPVQQVQVVQYLPQASPLRPSLAPSANPSSLLPSAMVPQAPIYAVTVPFSQSMVPVTTMTPPFSPNPTTNR